MFAVSDTSPISNLAIIGRLDLARTRFEKIWIPASVEAELDRLPHPVARAAVQDALRLGWIVPRPIPDNATIRLLAAVLDRGEAEAIALAVEMSADWILLDETDGPNAASRAGLRVTGVLGILLRAKQRGEIALLKPEMEALRTRARFFIATRLENEVLRMAGE